MTLNKEQDNFYFKLSAVFISAIFIFKLLYILFSGLSLSPEEAYYWTYSIHPAMGYFDHPPMIAWTIMIFTKFFGTSEFSIRFGAVVLSLVTNIFFFLSMKKLFKVKTAFFSLVILNFVFVFSLYSVFFTPDSLLICFWVISFYLFLISCEKDCIFWWTLLGITAGCAMLSKYTGVFIPASLFMFCLFTPSHRRFLIKIIYASIISLIVFSPVILWNYQHNFASFAFQSVNRFSDKAGVTFSNIMGFWLMQALYFTPFIFIAFAYAALSLMREKEKPFSEKLLLYYTLFLFLFFVAVSLRTWAKPNWTAPSAVFAAGMIAVFYLRLIDEKKSLKAKVYIISSILVAAFMNVLFYFQPLAPVIFPSLSKADSTMGWKALAQRVETERAKMPENQDTFIIGNGYELASEFKFYTAIPSIFSRNAFGLPALAYDYWESPEKMKGANAIVVSAHYNEEPDDLLGYFFESYVETEPFEVKVGDAEVRSFRIFRCFDYKGVN